MTDKADKAAAAKVEDKQDAAYEKYEAEQADHEKKHPGEIDEPAYAKYEAAYDKAEAGKAVPAEAHKLHEKNVKHNVPRSPAYAPGIPTDDESQTVSLFHMSEDGTERVYTRVHPEMVGNFMRAGWSRV